MPAAIATATARITANRVSGRVSGLGEMSPGISATGCGCGVRPRTSHTMDAYAVFDRD